MSGRKPNPLAQVTATSSDEDIRAIAIANGLEIMTPERRKERALEQRARAVVEALADRPAALEAWLAKGEQLAKARRA